MKKRCLSAALAVLLSAGLLAGCQQQPDPNALQLKTEGPEKTVLTLFMTINPTSDNVDIYKDIIADYNSKSETVELRVDGLAVADGFNEALEQRLDAGGSGADLFIVNADSVKALYTKGYFYDLSELSVYPQLTEAAKAEASINGMAYTIPIQMTAYGLYVNVSLLEQYGLEPPQNFDAFLHCCEVLKANGIVPLSLNRWYAMTAPTLSRGLYPIYQSADKDAIIAGLNDGSVKIGDYMLDGFSFFADLVQKGYYGDGITAEQTDTIKANTSDWKDFVSGKTAFAVFTTGKEKSLAEEAPHMDFIQQGFPVLPDGTVCMPAAATRLCVNAKGEHLQEALEVMEYITATRAEKFLQDGSGYLSAIEGIESAAVDPRVQALYEDAASPGQVPIEDMSLRFTYWDTVRELCLAIIDGMTPEQAAEEYNRIQMEQIEIFN